MMKLPGSCNRRMPARGAAYRQDGGFTLTELVVTIAIAAILATVAVPSFNNIIAVEHAKAAASELYTSLFTARAEAIRLDQRITLSENTGGWKYGWTIASAGGTIDTHGAMQGLSLKECSGAGSVTYLPYGRLAPNAAPMFVITATTGSSTSVQSVSVDPTGTPYIQAGPIC